MSLPPCTRSRRCPRVVSRAAGDSEQDWTQLAQVGFGNDRPDFSPSSCPHGSGVVQATATQAHGSACPSSPHSLKSVFCVDLYSTNFRQVVCVRFGKVYFHYSVFQLFRGIHTPPNTDIIDTITYKEKRYYFILFYRIFSISFQPTSTTEQKKGNIFEDNFMFLF